MKQENQSRISREFQIEHRKKAENVKERELIVHRHRVEQSEGTLLQKYFVLINKIEFDNTGRRQVSTGSEIHLKLTETFERFNVGLDGHRTDSIEEEWARQVGRPKSDPGDCLEYRNTADSFDYYIHFSATVYAEGNHCRGDVSTVEGVE